MHLRAWLARFAGREDAFDASFWSITDPATLLPTAGVVHNLPSDACEPYFEHELLVPDVTKFAELAGAARTVGVLSQATGGRPSASRWTRRHDLPDCWSRWRIRKPPRRA